VDSWLLLDAAPEIAVSNTVLGGLPYRPCCATFGLQLHFRFLSTELL
jgi:hypothetical protein